MKLRYLTALSMVLLTENLWASSIPEGLQRKFVDDIRKERLSTINVGGIGRNGKKEHAFWADAHPTDFVISIDPQVNPHMLADGFCNFTKVNMPEGYTPIDVRLALDFFTEGELGTLRTEKLITHIKYEHVGYGFITSFVDESSKKLMGAEHRIGQLTSILPEEGTFEYSSFWVGLENYPRTPNALNPSILSTSIGDLVGEKNSRTTSDQFEETQQELDALNRRVFQLEAEALKLKDDAAKKKNQSKQKKIKERARALFETLSSQPVTEIKGFEVFIRERLSQPEGTLELKPFSDHQEFFPFGSKMELYYDILKNKFGLGDIHFYVDKVNPLHSSEEDKFLYCLRMTGVKGAEAQEIKPKISLKGSSSDEEKSGESIFESIYSQKVEDLFKSYLTPKNSLKEDWQAHNHLAEKFGNDSSEQKLAVKQDLEKSLKLAVQDVFSSIKSHKKDVTKEKIELALRFQKIELDYYKANPVKRAVVEEEL